MQVSLDGHDISTWLDPEQEALSAKHASLTAILAELKPFEMHSATLSQVCVPLQASAGGWCTM